MYNEWLDFIFIHFELHIYILYKRYLASIAIPRVVRGEAASQSDGGVRAAKVWIYAKSQHAELAGITSIRQSSSVDSSGWAGFTQNGLARLAGLPGLG